MAKNSNYPLRLLFLPHFLSVHNNAMSTSNTNAKLRTKYSPEEHIARGNLWGIATMLDGFLSLQLGRTPAVAEVLKPHLPSNPTNGHGTDTSPNPINGLISNAPRLKSTATLRLFVFAFTNYFQDQLLAVSWLWPDMSFHSLCQCYSAKFQHWPGRDARN